MTADEKRCASKSIVALVGTIAGIMFLLPTPALGDYATEVQVELPREREEVRVDLNKDAVKRLTGSETGDLQGTVGSLAFTAKQEGSDQESALELVSWENWTSVRVSIWWDSASLASGNYTEAQLKSGDKMISVPPFTIAHSEPREKSIELELTLPRNWDEYASELTLFSEDSKQVSPQTDGDSLKFILDGAGDTFRLDLSKFNREATDQRFLWVLGTVGLLLLGALHWTNLRAWRVSDNREEQPARQAGVQPPGVVAGDGDSQGGVEPFARTRQVVAVPTPDEECSKDSPPETDPLRSETKLPVSKADGRHQLQLMVERWWADTKGDVASFVDLARKQELELYEWQGFASILQTRVPGATPLRFSPAFPPTPNPLFVGLKQERYLLLAPLRADVFANDMGLSALQMLFELRPRPNSKDLRFYTLLEPCRLQRQAGTWRLDHKGVISTMGGDASALLLTTGGVGADEGEREVASADVEALIADLRPMKSTILSVDEKIRRVLGAVTTLEQLIVPESRLRSLLEEATHILVSRLSTQETSKPTTVSEKPPLPSGFVPQAVRNLKPSSGTARSTEEGLFAGLSRILGRLDVQEGGTVYDYPKALEDLCVLVRGGIGGTEALGETDVGLFRAVRGASPERLSLSRVLLSRDAGSKRLQSESGEALSSEQFWQVFVAVSASVGELPPARVALLFSWSRLNKGAPAVAHTLVDYSRPGSRSADLVRCLDPAILGWRSDGESYAVERKMVVQPVDLAQEGG